ncbi:ParM/StbA family protein [Paenibacillus cisolokensis]|uniref:ParM/StbA family protein n=1 Tax=Paenibacillus cisolokensis TaxID=1658519 RepID=UPI003D282048
MGIVAIDAGGAETKVYDGRQLRRFPSMIGDWRERKLQQRHGEHDYEWEYDGRKGFAGTLALYESECAESQKGDTKAHPDARLRVLIALHQYAEGMEHSIVVGQPIGRHTPAEKDEIKRMLVGRHELTVNGERRVLVIRRCEVAAEGVTAGLLATEGGTIRVIDIGSGTVNFGTLIDRRFNDRGSFTLPAGLETVRSADALGRQIALRALAAGWKGDDALYLCGGGAEPLMPHIKVYFPGVRLLDGDPVFANVRAFYLIARRLYGG